MYELINGTPMPVREYNGQRVVTFRDIDSVHQRPDGTAKRNFNVNSKHFIEGVDYFVRNSYEAKTEFGIVAPNGLMLVTLSGYLMIAKSFKDDLSWGVQRMLVTYFTAREQDNNYSDLLWKQRELESRLELLENKLAKKSVQLQAKSPEENADYVLEKLCKSGKKVFSKSEVLIKCRPLKAKQINPALEILAEMHLISYQKRDCKHGNSKEMVEIFDTWF